MALKLLSPWQVWYRDVDALFKEDPEVRVVFDNDTYELTLYVDNADKADALAQLMPVEKEFGNVTVKVLVVPCNTNGKKVSVPLNPRTNPYARALKGNGALADIQVVSGIMVNDIIYVIFRKRVVQYYIDNLGDAYGNRSTLYQDIAANVFEMTDGICFCTDIEDPVVYSQL